MSSLPKPVICPHCQRQAIMEDAPDLGEEKWPDRPDKHEPRVRCPICTASFTTAGLRAFLKKH